MKKYYIIFFILFFLFIPVPSPAFAQEKLTIDKLNEFITVEKTGIVSVREDIDFGIQPEEWKTTHKLQYVIYKKNGKRYKFIYRDILIKSDKGTVPFSMYLENGFINLVIKQSKNQKIPEKISVLYTVEGLIDYEDQFDTITWKTGSNKWSIPIASVDSNFAVPFTLPDNPASHCVIGAQTCVIKKQTNKISFSALRLDEKKMTVNFRFPKNKIAKKEAPEYISIFKTWKGKLFILITLIVLGWWYLLYPIRLIIKHRKSNKKIIKQHIVNKNHLQEVFHYYLLLIPLSIFTLNIILLLTLLFRVLPFYKTLQR